MRESDPTIGIIFGICMFLLMVLLVGIVIGEGWNRSLRNRLQDDLKSMTVQRDRAEELKEKAEEELFQVLKKENGIGKASEEAPAEVEDSTELGDES